MQETIVYILILYIHVTVGGFYVSLRTPKPGNKYMLLYILGIHLHAM